MCFAQGPQRSDADEAWTHGPSIWSQALYHWATALPQNLMWHGSSPTDDEWTQNIKGKWATTWDFQQCGMRDKQTPTSACAYAQSDQSLC